MNIQKIDEYLDDLINGIEVIITELTQFHFYVKRNNSLSEYYKYVNLSLMYLFRIKDFLINIKESIYEK